MFCVACRSKELVPTGNFSFTSAGDTEFREKRMRPKASRSFVLGLRQELVRLRQF